MHSRPPLPEDVIDRLFSALTLRYGSPFLDRWRELDLSVVKSDWALQLAGFASNLKAIRFALDHLPEKPPTVMDFKRLADSAPETALAIVHDPGVRGPTPEERAALKALAADIRSGNLFAKPGRQWAYDLVRCHEQGWRNGERFRSTPAALAMARDAIATDPNRRATERQADDWQEAA